MSKIKKLVSKSKRRYTEDGFDLDLTYISPNLLAMGFPADKVEGIYRNNIDDVVKFLESKHPNTYKVYNLCSERSYDSKKFHHRVASYPFDDHNPPQFELIKPFCEDVDQWLGLNKDNIAAIHCKAGKGRTGVMICCYLLHRKRFTSSTEVLDFYSQARTNNMKGVTIPSQIRYVNYYSDLVKSKLLYKPTTLLLHGIRFDGMTLQHNASIVTSIHQVKVKLYTSNPDRVVKGDGFLIYDLSQPLPLCGDVKIEVNYKSGLRKEKLFHFWFNTFFVKQQQPQHSSPKSPNGSSQARPTGRNINGSLPYHYRRSHSHNHEDLIKVAYQKTELDRVNKSDAGKLLPSHFQVVLAFSRMRSPEDSVLTSSTANMYLKSPSESGSHFMDSDDPSHSDSEEAEEAEDWSVSTGDYRTEEKDPSPLQ